MLLFELSGEAPDIAVQEIRALALAYGNHYSEMDADGRAFVAETDAPVQRLGERLALTWSVSTLHSSSEPSNVGDAVEGLDIPGKSFRVTVKRLGGTHRPEETVRITRELGTVLSKGRKVDLENPDAEVIVLLGERAHIGVLEASVDRSLFESRRSENRPFSQPISLHPKFTRALINLTGVKEGQSLLDPFCGTGGILLEAGLMGIGIHGSDIDERMVAGTRRNLTHYGVKDFKLKVCDVSEIPNKSRPVDVIATDPPYGRSASTAKENIESLYERAFKAFAEVLKPDGKLTIVLPSQKLVKIGEEHFTLLGEYPVRVHKSLTRRFCVYRI
jgi:tRNA (guanine10-N2)-dimethyltransferase